MRAMRSIAEEAMMARYKVSRSFGWDNQLSEKARAVCRMFGLTAERIRRQSVLHGCSLEIKQADIVYITGPSGSGKSVLLGELEGQIQAGERINLSQVELPEDGAVIDCIEGDLISSLKVLNTAGLNDVYCVLNRPAFLSDGQKWRFRLAAAIKAGKKFVIADEFCSQLDRITAACVAYNVRRFAKQNGVTFILAGSQDDILLDLQPDVLVVKDLSGQAEVIYREYRIQNSAVGSGKVESIVSL
jgi:ABC-type ATPase with predicted acetyltransferase domain